MRRVRALSPILMGRPYAIGDELEMEAAEAALLARLGAVEDLGEAPAEEMQGASGGETPPHGSDGASPDGGDVSPQPPTARDAEAAPAVPADLPVAEVAAPISASLPIPPAEPPAKPARKRGAR